MHYRLGRESRVFDKGNKKYFLFNVKKRYYK
jgi:hypothetical protein